MYVCDNCKVIAEGIETQEELDASSFHGVHYGRGAITLPGPSSPSGGYAAK
jgi:EAL domain-containing protein (putative c-di-GMP-specific phosphodiesterase class I)